jgi:hypothetical protein
VNVGVAAHITAAAPDGPRFDPSLEPDARTDASNGIWLCQNDGKLVDNDLTRFTADRLRDWKSAAEQRAADAVGKAWTSSAGALSSQASILQRIGDSSRSDWTYYDSNATYHFKPDVHLRIENRPPKTPGRFEEPWATKFPDPIAHAARFTVCYGTTAIADVYAASVDGGRSYIPYPQARNDLRIDDWHYTFGRIVNLANGLHDFDEYLSRAGITVVPQL